MTTVTFDPEGCLKYPNTAVVEDLLGGIGVLLFPDGTVQFAENKTYPDVVYSPRLTEDELEVFCKNHLTMYKQYREVNVNAIEAGGELPPIPRFWE